MVAATRHRPGIRASVAVMTRDDPHFFSYFQNRPLPWAIHSRDSSIRFWRVWSVFASAIQTTYSLRNDTSTGLPDLAHPVDVQAAIDMGLKDGLASMLERPDELLHVIGAPAKPSRIS